MNRENMGQEFVGKTLAEVEKMPYLDYRVMMQDGEAFFGTCDYKPYRFNFSVENGIITSVSMG